jgi:hypothetical protein
MATNTYVALRATTVTGSSVSSVTLDLTGITGYTDLVLVVQGRFDSANQIREFRLRFNGDSGTNYSSTRLIGDGSSPSSDRLSNFSNMRLGVMPAATATSGIFGNAICHIMNYSNATTYKTVLNRTNDAQGWVVGAVGLWRNTAAITSIDVAISETQTGNWVVGSTFTVYGIASAAETAKATGGYITSDDTYFYHVFNATGTFTPKQSLTAECLVIAGGGGGGYNAGGGGGAGGLRLLSSQSFVNATAYTATVGGPGSGGNGGSGTAGVASSISGTGFTTISASGGGQGQQQNVGNGASGGSGGGTAKNNGTPYSGNTGGYSPVEGYAGGTGGSSGAAGGGGAGGVGGNGATNGGTGGVGNTSITAWLTATGTGVSGLSLIHI